MSESKQEENFSNLQRVLMKQELGVKVQMNEYELANLKRES